MTTPAPPLAAFLLARIAEDERHVRERRDPRLHSLTTAQRRVLAEGGAKRQIVELWRTADRDDADFGESRTFYSGRGEHRDDWGVYTFNVPIEDELRRVAAMRQVLARCAAIEAGMPSYYLAQGVLRLLASQYADRDGYRAEEWA